MTVTLIRYFRLYLVRLHMVCYWLQDIPITRILAKALILYWIRFILGAVGLSVFLISFPSVYLSRLKLLGLVKARYLVTFQLYSAKDKKCSSAGNYAEVQTSSVNDDLGQI